MHLPEEITDNILQYTPHPSVLAVSKSFRRIGLPHVYSTVQLPARAPVPAEHLGLVKKAIVRGQVSDVLKDMTGVVELDIEMVEDEGLEEAFGSLTNLRILRLRKDRYTSCPSAKKFLFLVANAIHKHWNHLEVVQIDWKVSEPFPSPTSPTTVLTQALASLPCLHTLATPMPSLWSDWLLTIANESKSLKVIQMGYGVMPTGLWMNGAVNHPKLMQLVKKGTTFIRCRAQTLPTQVQQQVERKK